MRKLLIAGVVAGAGLRHVRRFAADLGDAQPRPRTRQGRLVSVHGSEVRLGAEAGGRHDGRRRRQDADQRVLAPARRWLRQGRRAPGAEGRPAGRPERGRPTGPAVDRRDHDHPGLQGPAGLAADRRQPAAGHRTGGGRRHPRRERERRRHPFGRALCRQRPARQRRARRPLVHQEPAGRRQGGGDRGHGRGLRRSPAHRRLQVDDRRRGRQVPGRGQHSRQLGPPALLRRCQHNPAAASGPGRLLPATTTAWRSAWSRR